MCRAAVCLLAVALMAACGGDDEEAPPRYAADGRIAGVTPKWRPHVVVVDLSGLRFDDVRPAAAGGAPPPPVPTVFQDLFQSAAFFPDAASPSAWYAPGVASLFTGTGPQGHNVMPRSAPRDLILPSVTLAEILKGVGYRTGAFTTGRAIAARFGFSQGFDTYEEGFRLDTGRDAVAAWLAQGGGATPTLLFLRAPDLDPPFVPVPGHSTLASDLPRRLAAIPPAGPRAELPLEAGKTITIARLFDGEAYQRLLREWGDGRVGSARARWLAEGYPVDPDRYVLLREVTAARRETLKRLDASLSSLLVSIDAVLPPKDTVLVVFSDHGCALGERPSRPVFGGGRSLFDEQVHVPLWVRAPGRLAAGDIAGSCAPAGVLPTLLDLMGMPPLSATDGRSLLGLAARPKSPGRVILMEERRREEGSKPGLRRLFGLRCQTAKYIAVFDLRTKAATEEVYDLAADPGETTPLPGEDLERFGADFAAAVEALRARIRSDADHLRKLEQLGYAVSAAEEPE